MKDPMIGNRDGSKNYEYPLKKNDKISVSLNDETINLTVVDYYNGELVVRNQKGECMILEFSVSYKPCNNS